ncbi:hypothetical protein Egran_01189 [Elaphomyces granulatus]|uniref:Stc1 domain-containing protein n=1 Tax=Elaphomyces granulatus TaxID=519963 RepID=A0A232M3Q7_9EURO|nr:hypothetical protein Egran_01189 [Elaphomyces granulatus]
MAPVQSPYSGGYSEDIKIRLNNITLPQRIKCEICKKFRMQNAFSNKQLSTVRQAIYQYGPAAMGDDRPGYAKCRTCAGTQVVELLCSVCDKTKGLDEFAKSQRRNPDTARCINCVQNHLEADPVADEQKTAAGKESSVQGGSAANRNPYDEEMTRKSHRNLSLGEKNSESDTIAHGALPSVSAFREDDEDNASIGGGVWVESGLSGRQPREEKAKPRFFTAYDPKGTAHFRSTSPKPTPGGSDLQRRAAEIDRKKNTKFAKVPGARFEKHEAPTMRIPESQGQVIDESDDDEGDYDIQDYV